jgi:hypothetical protein
MSVITLKAHYDGKRICLDEPIDLAPNTPVLVTIAQPDAEVADRAECFARAYGDDEPDYSNAVILERP